MKLIIHISKKRKTITEKEARKVVLRVLKGGEGSGFESHRGQPGHQGGSLPRDAQGVNRFPTPDARFRHMMYRNRRRYSGLEPDMNSMPLTREKHKIYRAGAFESALVRIGSRGVGLLKPGHYANRETMAYEISKVCYLNNVPTVVYIPDLSKRITEAEWGTVDTREASLIKFEENSSLYKDITNPVEGEGSLRTIGQIYALDYIIGNFDRNSGNWLVRNDDQTIVAIDHGLTFPSHSTVPSDWNYESMYRATNLPVPSVLQYSGAMDLEIAIHPDDIKNIEKAYNSSNPSEGDLFKLLAKSTLEPAVQRTVMSQAKMLLEIYKNGQHAWKP